MFSLEPQKYKLAPGCCKLVPEAGPLKVADRRNYQWHQEENGPHSGREKRPDNAQAQKLY